MSRCLPAWQISGKLYGNDPTLAVILDSFELEVEMYRNYSKYHGYTFFVMQNELQVVNANTIV